jgi:hypothetical protein
MLKNGFRPRLLGLLGAALLWSVGNEVTAQDSPAALRQEAFLAVGDRWEAVRKALDPTRPQHAALAPCFAGDSAASGLVMSPTSLRHGESLNWELVPDGLPGALHHFEPELWVDGVLIGTGWHGSLLHVAALNADLARMEVRLPRELDTLKWTVAIPVKSTCIPPAPDLPPWSFDAPDNPWWISVPYGGGTVDGMAVTLLGSDGLFDRPLIVVEGFDPDLTDSSPSYGFGTMNWDAIWDCSDLAYPNTAAMAVLMDSLVTEGFDLVYVDFADGTRPADAQAALLDRVLDLVNETAVSGANSVVVGASMGGAIARLALRQRELAGISDCISQFITLDTPHQGAYLPIALQEALAFFSQQDVQAASLLEALNSPAARELLLLTPDGALPEHLALKAELDALGWPGVPHCLAISNGHPLVSLNQGGAALLEGVINDWGVNWAQIQLWPLPGNPYHSASTPSASVVFDCSIPNLDGAWWSDPVLSSTAHCDPSTTAWEDVPGSASPHIQALSQGLSNLGFDLVNSVDWTAFVPVASALDAGSGSELLRRHEPVGSAPAPHCDLTGHVDHLLEFILEGADDTASMDGDASGFPHWGHLRPMRTFMGGGVLQAGDEWTVGTPLGNGGWGTAWPMFTVELAPCASDLILEDGGALVIGETAGQGTGTFRISDGNTLQLQAGSTLSIGAGSVLRVRSGGTLALNGGSLLLSEGATLAVDPGGRIAVGLDSEIVLPAWSTWNQFGELVCLSGTTFLVVGEANSSVSLSGTTEVAENAAWRLEGLDAPLGVFLSGTAELTGPGEVKWQGLEVHQDPGSFLDLNATQRWNDVDVWSDGSSTISSYARWRWHGGSGDRLAIHHSRPGNADPFWDEVQLSASHVITEFCAPRIWDCQFTQSTWEAWFAAGGEWNTTAFAGNGLNTGLHIAHATGDVRLDGCAFSGCQTGLRLEHAEAHLACSTWDHNGIGIGLEEGGRGWLTGPNGGHNRFAGNGIHGDWSGGPWWECAGGHNEFGTFLEAGFTGELAGASSPLNEVLNAAHNHWDNELEYNGFSNTNLELLTLPTDTGPTSCGPASTPTPIDGSPKSRCVQHGKNIHWHPAQPGVGTLRLRDAIGRVLDEVHVASPQKEIVCVCPDFASGLHLMEWVPVEPGVGREAVWIWVQ